MDEVKGKLTVFFEEPFWVGVFERYENGKISVAKVTFGAEPKDYDVYEFVLTYLLKYRHFLRILALTCLCGFSGFGGFVTCNNERIGSKIAIKTTRSSHVETVCLLERKAQ